MTFVEYMEAMKGFRQYTDVGNNIRYPALGLVSEVGEMAGKLKKYLYRDKIDEADFRTAFMAELGDVMWYVAAVMHEVEIPCPAAIKPGQDMNDEDLYGIVMMMVMSSTRVANHAFSVDTAKANIDDIIRSATFLLFSAEVIAKRFGMSLGYILTSNIAKLSSRKERSVITGDGDNR